MKKRFLCRLGFHQWYVDAALIHSVRRCNYCDATEGDVEALDRERRRYIENPDVLDGKVMWPTMIPNPMYEEESPDIDDGMRSPPGTFGD